MLFKLPRKEELIIAKLPAERKSRRRRWPSGVTNLSGHVGVFSISEHAARTAEMTKAYCQDEVSQSVRFALVSAEILVISKSCRHVKEGLRTPAKTGVKSFNDSSPESDNSF